MAVHLCRKHAEQSSMAQTGGASLLRKRNPAKHAEQKDTAGLLMLSLLEGDAYVHGGTIYITHRADTDMGRCPTMRKGLPSCNCKAANSKTRWTQELVRSSRSLLTYY